MARELKAEQLPEVSWDFVYGTNMQHGFLLSRQMLARQTGTKQIIMITDGEPTAHIESGTATPFFSYPPVPETIDATLREVARCTRDGIRINTFMLDANSYLKAFVEKLTQMNRGRAFFTTPETWVTTCSWTSSSRRGPCARAAAALDGIFELSRGPGAVAEVQLAVQGRRSAPAVSRKHRLSSAASRSRSQRSGERRRRHVPPCAIARERDTMTSL